MFINLDMAKAYDRVKWRFLRNILLSFSSSSAWVSWTMSHVTSSSFFVLPNDQPSQLFGASRGLHQGDPLSPYLFIIMDEGWGRFIKHQVSQNYIHRWRWGNGLPSLSHLQFVDDSTLARIARVKEAKTF